MADDLAEEIEFHREMKERDLQAQGSAPDVARIEARRALGNELAARQRAHDVWVPACLQDVLQDLRFAGRLLIKDRAFTAVAVTALGLGIGVNNTLFTMVNAFCIRGLPIDQPERTVYIESRDAAGRDRAVPYPDFVDLRTSARTLDGVAAFASSPVAIRDEERAAERFQGVYISSSAFRLIGSRPMHGRDFHAEDDRAGAPKVVILSGGIWRSRYGGASDIVGRSIVVNGMPAIVIGVMPDGFGFPNNAEVWQPLASMPGLSREDRSARTLEIFARLADGMTVADARAEIEGVGQRLARDHRPSHEGIRLTAVPINERYLQRLTHPAWLAFITTGALVVAIACANVANLLLSRGIVRVREVAIRASLGASRLRLVRQLLIESALLSLLGGLLGLALSYVGVRLQESAIPSASRAYWLDFSMDGLVFGVLTGVCVVTVFASGLVPALYVARTDTRRVLSGGGRGITSGLHARRWMTVFLTAEFALTMVMLSGVGGTVRGFREQQLADRVLDPSPLLTMMLSLPAQKYQSPAQRSVFYAGLTERLEAVGLSGATIASATPLGGGALRDLIVEAGSAGEEQTRPRVRTLAVGDDYFATLGLKLFSGREFTAVDGTPGHENAVINQRFAKMYFGDEDPIGRRIQLGSVTASGTAMSPLTIVGVSPSVRQRPVLEPEPVVYVPYRADPPTTAALIVRAHSSNAATVAARVREELRALDPDLPIYRVLPMDAAMNESMWNVRVSWWAITIISFIAVSLSIVGLYAVTAHGVEQRTPELGVRLALGATPRQLKWLVLRRAIGQIVAGLAVGGVCTFAWDKLFATGRWADPFNVLAASVLLAAVAVLASLVPARRAGRLDPVLVLRAD